MRMYDKRCLAKERSPIGEGRGKPPNLRAKGYSSRLRGGRHASRSLVVDAREVRVRGWSPNITERTAFAVLSVMLVETTSHSPEGESVLQRGRGSFWVRRRQAAELARIMMRVCSGGVRTPDGVAHTGEEVGAKFSSVGGLRT